MTLKLIKVNRFLKKKNLSIKTVVAILLTLTIALLNILVSQKAVADELDFPNNKVYKLSANRPSPLISLELNRVNIKVVESVAEKVSREENEKKNASQNTTREVVARIDTNRSEAPSFEEKRVIVQNIASANGIDWKILEAVWQVESGKSWDKNVRSYAGAQGPMQFLPSTFRHYAPAGANINSARDSLEAGAKLLASAGANSGNVDKALFAYNHSSSYVAMVKRVAQSIE